MVDKNCHNKQFYTISVVKLTDKDYTASVPAAVAVGDLARRVVDVAEVLCFLGIRCCW